MVKKQDYQSKIDSMSKSSFNQQNIKTLTGLRRLYLVYLAQKYACSKELYFHSLGVLGSSVYNKNRQRLLIKREQEIEFILASLEKVIEKECGDDIDFLEKLDAMVEQEIFSDLTPEVFTKPNEMSPDNNCICEYIMCSKLFYATNNQETYEEMIALYEHYLEQRNELQAQITALNISLEKGLPQFVKLSIENAKIELILSNIKEIMIQKFGESINETLTTLESNISNKKRK